MQDTIYKIIWVEGDHAYYLTTDKKYLAEEYAQNAKATNCHYAFERHSGNPYNDNIHVEGYYWEGKYFNGGWAWHNHYDYRYKRI